MALRFHPLLSKALFIVATACAAGVAWGNDRPFQEARTAVREDEENVWSMDSWMQRFGRVRGLSIEPEYTFGGGNSVQVELTRLFGRRGAPSGQNAEIEFKHIFNDIARDGWGIGVSAAFARERNTDEGTNSRSVTFRLPVSVALGEATLVHLNPGMEKRSGERRAFNAAVAGEHEVVRRWVLFAELSRDGEQHYGQVGLRRWVRKEKLAIDFALQQFRPRDGGARSSGWLLGMSLYDL
jgi:hypothetical protein